MKSSKFRHGCLFDAYEERRDSSWGY